MIDKVSAVVVSYNSVDSLPLCLDSLKSSGINQIVAVDNNSSDKSVDIARKHGATTLLQTDNLGFGRACNIGAAVSQSEYMLFINPDAYLQDGALSQVLAVMANNPHCGVVGFRLLSSSGQPELDNYGSPITPFTLFTRHWQRPNTTSLVPIKCGWVSGGAMLVRRTAWQETGGFDPGYFLYWEDVDLCYRMQRKGWQVFWVPSAKVVHGRGASLSDQGLKTRFYDESADRYFRTHYAAPIWRFLHYLRRLYRLVSPLVR